jgi:hypothetical protein
MKARRKLCGLLILVAAASSTAWAVPYTPVALPPGAVPGLGAGVIPAPFVFGKEYSHDLDHDFMGVPDPEQIVIWDGIGGTDDGIDISLFPRLNFTAPGQIDAIANHADALFTPLREDRAHLVFTHDDFFTQYIASPTGGPPVPFSGPSMPAVGPIMLSNGFSIGGAAEISVETAGFYGPVTQGLWAAAPTINGMAPLRDIDGIELWGPEPGYTGDTDKYSLDVDVLTGGPGGPTSVWNLSGSTYIGHATIVAAVTALLGPIPATAYMPTPSGDQFPGIEGVNLDALMVRELFGDIDTFDRNPDGGPGDQIIFSIRQIVDPADPDGYYATGSELFVLDGSTGPAGTTYLMHGGHLWDHMYALTSLAVGPGGPFNGRGVIDINGIEAIGEAVVVPEPASMLLGCLALAGVVVWRKRV